MSKYQIERCKKCGKWKVIEIEEKEDIPLPSDMNKVLDKRCGCEEPLKANPNPLKEVR